MDPTPPPPAPPPPSSPKGLLWLLGFVIVLGFVVVYGLGDRWMLFLRGTQP